MNSTKSSLMTDPSGPKSRRDSLSTADIKGGRRKSDGMVVKSKSGKIISESSQKSSQKSSTTTSGNTLDDTQNSSAPVLKEMASEDQEEEEEWEEEAQDLIDWTANLQ